MFALMEISPANSPFLCFQSVSITQKVESIIYVEKLHNSYLDLLNYRKEVTSMSSDQPKIMTQEARCGVRLNYVIFPIDFRDLRYALAKNGYELSSISERIPSPPARIRFSGDVARKGETSVVFESDSGSVIVVGRSLQEVKESFQELARVIDSELGVNLHENVKYYSYSVHYKVDTGKTPRDEIAKAENKDYIARFGQVLGKDLSSFSIRLAPKDAIPNQENWFDIVIEPDVMNDKLYHAGIVFRNPNKGKTERFVKDLENTLLRLIRTIEA